MTYRPTWKTITVDCCGRDLVLEPADAAVLAAILRTFPGAKAVDVRTGDEMTARIHTGRKAER